MSPLTELQALNRDAGGRPRLRKAWLVAHRWIGLTVGLLYVLIGLSGSVLVFDHAIDEWLNPGLLLTEGAGARRPLQEIIDAAEQDFDGQALSVTKPRVDNGVWTVWFSSGSREQPRFTAVHVDPYTARVTGQRVWGQDLLSWIYRLHFQLLAGRAGAVIIGLTGVILMLSLASGLYLWWPLWKHSWRAAFAIRSGPRFNYDLHKTLGIGSLAFLLVLSFTGVYMEFPDWVKPLVTVFSDETSPPEDLRSNGLLTRQPISPDEALEIARQYFPHAAFDHLHPPEGPDGTYEVAFRQPDEVQESFGRSQVFLDQYTGEVLALRNPDDFTPADTFLAWQFPLHSGEAFGLIGRWVVFFSGLTPAGLYASGFLMWRRRRHRRSQHSRLQRTEPLGSAVTRESEPTTPSATISRRSVLN